MTRKRVLEASVNSNEGIQANGEFKKEPDI